MPGHADPEDAPSENWRSTLERWRSAELLDAEAAEQIVAWEAQQASQPLVANRISDTASYLGVSIVLIGALMLVALLHGDSFVSMLAPLAVGVVGAAVARLARASNWTALADAAAAASVVLISVGWALLLDEIGGQDQEAIGWLLICGAVLLIGALMARLAQSPLATLIASAAFTLLPLAIAVEGDALRSGIFGSGGYGPRLIEDWAQWSAFTVSILTTSVALLALDHPRRWLHSSLAPWGRWGASLGGAFALLSLAAVSPEPVMDWMMLLAGWVITAWAIRSNRVDLLHASGLLLIGALSGGLSDLHDGTRLGLTIVSLLTTLQLTALGLVGPRLLERLATHWLTPIWESALLAAGIIGATMLAATTPALAAIGIVWALALLTAGAVAQHRLSTAFGLIGVYASGLMLLIDELQSGLAAIVGTLIFGVLIVSVAVAVRWRRRAAQPLIDTDSGRS